PDAGVGVGRVSNPPPAGAKPFRPARPASRRTGGAGRKEGVLFYARWLPAGQTRVAANGRGRPERRCPVSCAMVAGLPRPYTGGRRVGNSTYEEIIGNQRYR